MPSDMSSLPTGTLITFSLHWCAMGLVGKYHQWVTKPFLWVPLLGRRWFWCPCHISQMARSWVHLTALHGLTGWLWTNVLLMRVTGGSYQQRPLLRAAPIPPPLSPRSDLHRGKNAFRHRRQQGLVLWCSHGRGSLGKAIPFRMKP